MATKHQKFSISLKGYSTEEREAIALEAIRKIQKRTKQGIDKDGDKFPDYSKAYKNSLNFKIGGKSSKVNLTLSGDMLDSIEILRNQAGKVEIGYQKGTTENGKADGNIRGTYGQDKPIEGGKYARDFLGLTQKELQEILRKYPKGTEESLERAQKEIIKQSNAEKLSGKVDLDELESED